MPVGCKVDFLVVEGKTRPVEELEIVLATIVD